MEIKRGTMVNQPEFFVPGEAEVAADAFDFHAVVRAAAPEAACERAADLRSTGMRQTGASSFTACSSAQPVVRSVPGRIAVRARSREASLAWDAPPMPQLPSVAHGLPEAIPEQVAVSGERLHRSCGGTGQLGRSLGARVRRAAAVAGKTSASQCALHGG